MEHLILKLNLMLSTKVNDEIVEIDETENSCEIIEDSSSIKSSKPIFNTFDQNIGLVNLASPLVHNFSIPSHFSNPVSLELELSFNPNEFADSFVNYNVDQNSNISQNIVNKTSFYNSINLLNQTHNNTDTDTIDLNITHYSKMETPELKVFFFTLITILLENFK